MENEDLMQVFLDHVDSQEDEIAEEKATLEVLKAEADVLVQLEDIIADLEEELSSVKDRHRYISQTTVPNIMNELGIKTFTLDDGTSLKVEDFLTGSLPKNEEAFNVAIKWLEDHDLSHILKTDVNLKFDKGEEEKAQLVVDLLKENGYDADKKFSAHHMTLCSAIKEYDKTTGEQAPYELLGLNKGKKTKVKKA